MATRLTQTGEEVQEILNESEELPFIRRGIGYNSIKYGVGSIAGLYHAKIYLRGIDFTNNKVYLSADETADIVTSNFSEVYDAKIDLSPYLNSHVLFIYHDGTLERSFVTQTKGNILYLNSLRSNRVLSNKVYTEEPIRFNGLLFTPIGASAFQGCSALGASSHAEGADTLALSGYSHTEGLGTMATNMAEHAEGKYNKSNEGTIHSVGIGGSTSNRKNAHEIMQDGKHFIFGIGGYDGTNPDTAKDLATVLDEATDLATVLDEIPFEKGSAENSAVLKGGNNQVFSENSVATGSNNIAGLKGWYYGSINKINDTTIDVYISESQVALPTWGGTTKLSTINPLNVLGIGWFVSLVNDAKYDNQFKVVGGGGGRIRLQTVSGNLPFSSIAKEYLLDPEDYSIYCLSKPDAGIADIGQGSFTTGYNNKATNGKSAVFGFNNHAYGKFSFVEGRDNKAGYAAHAEGRGNIASGEQSHVEGRNTVSAGNNSHAEGEGATVGGVTSLNVGAHGRSSHVEGMATTTGEYNEQTGIWSKGDAAHAEGNSTIASGNHAHAEGSGTKASGWQAHAEGHNTIAKGNRAHAEGSGTEALNLAEHAQGSFNKSNTNTIHSVGIGTSDTDRKNAHEIMQDGKHYIYGIGGYDGTNPDTAKDLVAALDELTQLDPEKYWTKDETEAAIKQQIDFVAGVDLSAYYTGRQVDEKLDDKQDKIADLETIRTNASAVTTKQDKIADLETIRTNASAVTTKQDKIEDLETIRANALKGATAGGGISEADLLNKYLNGQGRFPNDSQWVPIAGDSYYVNHEILGNVYYWPVSTSVTGDKGAFVKCLKYVGDNEYEYTYFYIDLSNDKIVHVRCADSLYYITAYNGQLVIYTQNSNAQISEAEFSVAPVYETESEGPAQMVDALIPTTIARHEDLFDLVEGLIGSIGISRVIDPVVHVDTVLDITSDPDDFWGADINLTTRQYLLLYRFGKALTDVNSTEFLKYFNFIEYSETDYVYNHEAYNCKIIQTQVGEHIQWEERFANDVSEESAFKFSLKRNDYEYAERGKFHIEIERV